MGNPAQQNKLLRYPPPTRSLLDARLFPDYPAIIPTHRPTHSGRSGRPRTVATLHLTRPLVAPRADPVPGDVRFWANDSGLDGLRNFEAVEQSLPVCSDCRP